MRQLPKLFLGVRQRAVPARKEPDPVETANGGSAVGTLKKMYDVLTDLEAVGFTLVDTLLPACDGWLHTMHQNSTGKKIPNKKPQEGSFTRWC